MFRSFLFHLFDKIFIHIKIIPNPFNRVCLFACHIREDNVPSYLLLYLKEIKKIAQIIVLVSDIGISYENKKKLFKYVDFILDDSHREYDFGSYKRGFIYSIENHILDYAQELIICNDSCFKTGVSFKTSFKKMAKEDCDFWGIKNLVQTPHLQSYFWVLSRKAFLSTIFYTYMLSINGELPKSDIVLKYEVPFLKKMEEGGLKSGYLFEMADPHTHPLSTIKLNSPLIKRKIFEKTGESLDTLKDVFSYLYKKDRKTYWSILKYYSESKVKNIVFSALQK